MRPGLPSHTLPTRTIRKIIERGIRNHAGGQVDYQIYTTDTRSLEEVLREMRRQEYRIARDHLEMLTVGFWRGALAKLEKWCGRASTEL